jgi:GTP cyclohydrolase II
MLRLSKASDRITVAATAKLPTRFGDFEVFVFSDDLDPKEHLALVRGSIRGVAEVPTRLHSECLTGDVLASLRCDCREQLERALETLGSSPCGILLYMRQEGRGIGLTNKLRAYGLQERGLDTVEANLALGFRDDERDYGVAAAMLRTLGVGSIALMTNNPDKVSKLREGGVEVARRVPHAFSPNAHNRDYLRTKRERSGHLLDIEMFPEPDARGDG